MMFIKKFGQMIKNNSDRFMLLVLFISLQNSDVAFAQESSIDISTMKISLWSEYDNPNLLVMYKGRVSSNVKLPVTIKFSIVPGIEPHVASVTLTNEHIHDPFDIVNEEGDTYVSFLLKEREFAIEYYYKAFPPLGSNKSFIYNYKSYYPINSFSYEIQQPISATNFITQPSSIRSVSDSKGILNHLVLTGAVAAGEIKTVSVSYFKSSKKTSLQLLENPDGKWSTYNIISIIALAMLVGLLIRSYYKKGRRKGSGIQRAGAKKVAQKVRIHNQQGKIPTEKLKYRSDRVPRFCPNCGEKVDTGTNFCGSCGNQLA